MVAAAPADRQSASSTTGWIDITYAVEEALKELSR
jgi:hypothetical protein